MGGVKADDKHEKPIIIDKVQVVQENEVATERLNGNIIRSSHSSKDRHIDEDDGSSVDEAGEELKEQAIRAKRMQKIFDARDRYLKRIEIEQWVVMETSHSNIHNAKDNKVLHDDAGNEIIR